MKKILITTLALFLLAGCTDMMNTPTKRVEEFLGKYQTMDKEVLTQLSDILEQEGTMTEDQRKEYENLMKKQYQNLSYKIKDETVDGDAATVEVEIEVFDYHSAIEKAETYVENNKDEFLMETNPVDGPDNANTDQNNRQNRTTEVDPSKFMDYKIEQLKQTKEKVKYTLTFTLTKEEQKWILDDVSEVDRLKIHGLYNY